MRLSSSAHQTEQQQAAAAAPPQETQESLVWGDFDEQVAGLVTRTSSSAEALLEMRSYSRGAPANRVLQPTTLVAKPVTDLPQTDPSYVGKALPCGNICSIRKSFQQDGTDNL